MNKSKKLTKQHAIVLYTFQNNDRKVALLDSLNGKILCYVPDKRLQVGAHIEYQLVKKRRHVAAYDVEIVRMPFGVAREDILFLHHVLEMCYHFIPEGMPASDVFMLIEFMYRKSDNLASQRAKKLYLSKLFILFGIYPEKPYITLQYWNALLADPIERILELHADAPILHELAIWLRSCIHTHPLAHTFKTLKFINTNE